MSQPWSFHEARQASQAAELEQRRLEGDVISAYRDYAKTERVYRVALARRMLELKASGVAVTACETLAKGDPAIAVLREERDIAEGLRETSKHAAWRVNADRRDTSDFIRWSARRDLIEYAGPSEPEPREMETYGSRRVA